MYIYTNPNYTIQDMLFFWNPHLYDEHISLKRQYVWFPWVFFLSNDDLYNLDFIAERCNWQTRRINLIIQTIHRRRMSVQKITEYLEQFKMYCFLETVLPISKNISNLMLQDNVSSHLDFWPIRDQNKIVFFLWLLINQRLNSNLQEKETILFIWKCQHREPKEKIGIRRSPYPPRDKCLIHTFSYCSPQYYFMF